MLEELKAKFTPNSKPLIVLEKKPQVCSARFSTCGRLLVAGGFDGQIYRWDLSKEGFAELPAVPSHDGWITDITFSDNGTWMYSADSWGALACRNSVDPLAPLRWQVNIAHDGWIQSVAISPDGKFLLTGGNDRVARIWNSENGQKVRDLSGPTDPILKVIFHPDNKSALTGDLHGVIKQWDVETGQSTRTFDASVLFKEDRLQDTGGIRSLAFNQDGSLLAVGGTKPANGGNVQGIPTVLVFDWAAGTLMHTLELGGTGDVFVTDLKFHAAGFLMATVSGNPGTGKLVFRRVTDKEAFVSLTSIPNCHSLSLHPDGKRLVVTATNAGSNGNGRQLDKNGEYPDNFTPITILEIPNTM